LTEQSPLSLHLEPTTGLSSWAVALARSVARARERTFGNSILMIGMEEVVGDYYAQHWFCLLRLFLGGVCDRYKASLSGVCTHH